MDLRRLAEEAADCFLRAHPDEAERDDLVQDACLAVLTWSDRHGHTPTSDGHARRLMKSALWAHHERHETRLRRGVPSSGTR